MVTEALASGTPVVAYDYAAPSEFITEGVNGYLASMNDEEKLRVNLGKILSKSRDELSEFKRSARRSTDKADWNQILEKFQSDLLEILQQVKENQVKSFSPSPGTQTHPA